MSDRQDMVLERFEMLLRKMGHDPTLGYVSRGYGTQESMQCRRCGYSRRVGWVDEENLAACLVEDAEDANNAADQEPASHLLRAEAA